jgi:hypothetical protein
VFGAMMEAKRHAFGVYGEFGKIWLEIYRACLTTNRVVKQVNYTMIMEINYSKTINTNDKDELMEVI